MSMPREISELIERFERDREAYLSGQYNETQLRREFLDPLFMSLGWDIDNKQGYAEAYKDVIHEDAIKIGGVIKAPDYCFRIGGTKKFFVEAKKPLVKLKDDISPAFQLRRYAWSAKLPLSILTDFEEFAVYDCRVKPVKTDKASTARILYLTYNDFVQRWDEISSVFSRDAVLKGSFDKYAEKGKHKKGTAEVDNAFLQEIEIWRDMFAKNIALRNPGLTQRELNFAVQRIIDRIIFLRICEDRGIEEYGRLMSLLNGANVYKRLFQIFRNADERYNSGLFHFEKEKERHESPDDLTPSLDIDDKLLKDIIRRLYYPESPYEFSVLPADILGQVYEQFLGKVIRLTSGHRAIVEEKPEVRKAGGVYYTPTYIVDYIVKNTVGRLLGNQPSSDITPPPAAPPLKLRGGRGSYDPIGGKGGVTPKEVSKIRILDPACGSGSFLLGAYQYLLDWHRDWYSSNDPQKWATGKNPAIYQSPTPDPRSPNWHLTTAEKKRILLNNIYGVDIDSQAVEVTKLSLLLKVLEGESNQTLERQLKFFHERALPDLGDNIKCGNSLIGPDFYEQELSSSPHFGKGGQGGILDEEEKYRINVFDWNAEFPDVMKKGGFDAVIGNPPYIFTRELIKELEKDYYSQTYNQTQFKINTYLLFVEKGFYLLKDSGCLGFIIPNNWLTLETASRFRNFILKKTYSIQIVNSRDKVFERASVDASILVFRKTGLKEVIIYELENGEIRPIARNEPDDYLNLHNHIISYNVDKSGKKVSLCQKISRQGIPLESIAEVRNGIQAYTVGEGTPPQTEQMKRNRVYHGLEMKDNTWIKYVDGVDVGRYCIGWSKQFVKYGQNLSRPRKKVLFQGERVLVRQIPAKPPYSIFASYVNVDLVNDNNSMIVTQPKFGYSIKYLMGVLNSRQISFWFIHTFGKLQRKVFPQFKVRELRTFPIRAIDFTKLTDKARHDKMVSLVEQMLSLSKKLPAAKTDHEKTSLQRQIDATDKQIDHLVYELYDLTEEEIRIVEG